MIILFETIFPRVSCDKSFVNQTGRWFIVKCIDNQLFILNGRTLRDLNGQFTCHLQGVVALLIIS